MLQNRALEARAQDGCFQPRDPHCRLGGPGVRLEVGAGKDQRQLFGSADGPIQVEQAIKQALHPSPFLEDQVVAVFHLGHLQAMPITERLFLRGEERQPAR